jgi:murein DD-endopeptidase MepM/ murein hydrolase activator NlpD
MSHIDFDFVSKLEDGQHLDLYLPAAGTKESGLAIATRFELGELEEKDLKELKLPADLIAKLAPYLGQAGKDAEKLLKDKPLKLDKKEAELIDKAWEKAAEDELVAAFNKRVKEKGGKAVFDDLIPEAQTVVFSLYFQYHDLAARTKKFWDEVTSLDFNTMLDELHDFKDKSPDRRNKEADLLAKGIARIRASTDKQNPGPAPATAKDWVTAALGTDATRCFPLGKGWTKQDYHKGGISFGADRGARAHAACDLIAPLNTPIYAVADGTVIQEPYYFYTHVYALEIDHGDFTVRYGEILKDSAVVKKKGDKVKKGQMIAKVGKMEHDSMLHFEMYTGKEKGGLTNRDPKTSIKRKDGKDFQRRKDLVDPTSFLDAWKKSQPE